VEQILEEVVVSSSASKNQLFMSKSCSNILPIRTKLFDRKVISNYSCPVCGEEAEMINHMFMECSIALAVWDKHTNFMAFFFFFFFQSGMCFVDWVDFDQFVFP
jgi:hypothetical protein